MNPLRRARLFIRDYIEEFPIAWSLARTRDCERRGGHRWGEPEQDTGVLSSLGLMRTCKRCGCSESVHRTEGTGAPYGTIKVYPSATATTASSRTQNTMEDS